MWLSRLDLMAFGRFTETRLPLGRGFHLIYGQNEAGKSTTLRAIRQLLFGIDERTDDNFLHANPNLRIGGMVCDETGRRFEVIRRKSRKDSLRAGDDTTVIDAAEWQQVVCDIDVETFSNRYGINYEQLVQGGHDIAMGSGDLGEILFATGSGVMDLAAVQQKLSEEALDLFRPLGKKQRLNVAIAEWQTQRDLVLEKLLPVATWEESDQARQKVQSRLNELAGQIHRNTDELDRIGRWRKAWPLVSQLDTLSAQLEDLADVRPLQADFVARRQEAALQIRHSIEQRQAATAALAQIQQELNQLQVATGLLDRADELNRLFIEWGSYSKAQQDRLGLVKQFDQQHATVSQLQQSLGPDARMLPAPDFALDRTQRVRVGQLGRQQAGLTEALQQAERRHQQLSDLLQQTQHDLANLPNAAALDELRQVVRQTRNDGDLEGQQMRLQSELEQLQFETESQLDRLGVWNGSLGELRALTVLDSVMIQPWATAFDKTQQEITLVRHRLSDLERDHTICEREIERLRRDFQIPIETDLAAARTRRDDDWNQIRTAIAMGAAVPDQLLVSFDQRMTESDHLADLLRDHADRVAKLAELISDLAANESRQHEASISIAELEARRLALETDWQNQWQGLNAVAGSPHEMQTWILRREAVLQNDDLRARRAAELTELRMRLNRNFVSVRSLLIDESASPVVPPPKKNVGRKKAAPASTAAFDAAASRQQLSFGWEPPPSDGSRIENSRDQAHGLTHLLERAEQQIERDDQLQQQRTMLEEVIVRLTDELAESSAAAEKASADLAAWQAEWQQAITGLNLDPNVSPDEASVLVETLGEITDHQRQADQLRQRIDGIDADAERFHAQVKSVCQQIAPENVDRPVAEAVSHLQAKLTSSQRNQSKLNQQLARKQQFEHQLVQSQSTCQQVADLLAPLCEFSGISLPEANGADWPETYELVLPDLERVETQLQRRNSVDQQLQQLRERLQGLAVETPIEAFVDEVRQQTIEALEQHWQELNALSVTLTADREQLIHQLGGCDEKLSQIDGSAEAAEAEEQQRQWLARIRTDAQQFVRVKLASVVLRTAIERYREKTREPVLKVASALFQELTLGAFDGLRVDEEGNKSILVGVRAGGKDLVKVDGMSEGTCDQLYLALRLASLELEAAPRNQLPFIVDDILIQFDDARAAAALRVLARFGQRRQVIFFTHHEHLVEIARGNLSDDCSIQKLGA